ncbi:ribonuclease H2 subunit B isoform X2 [Tanacetum coccineum]
MNMIYMRLSSADGSLYTATQVDIAFILLPLFDEARMKNIDDQGKFRQLESEIIYLHGYHGYHHLALIAENFMQVVCDCKDSVRVMEDGEYDGDGFESDRPDSSSQTTLDKLSRHVDN